MPYTFAIIGGGFTGTSMLCQLVDRLREMGDAGVQISRKLVLVVFEKKAVFGPGLPHNGDYVYPFHITNMCARDMTVRSAHPSEFQDWVQHNIEALQKLYPDLKPARHSEDCCHYPRAVMGDYLKSSFADAVNAARNLGISVALHSQCEVTDLTEQEGQICLKISRKHTDTPALLCADGVLLATGHWDNLTGMKNYFSSPWPASKLLAKIAAKEKVGVIGSSLSAIEVALTLTSDGKFIRQPSGELHFAPSSTTRKLTFYSRNGLLPRVRGKIGKRKNVFLTCNALYSLIQDHPNRLTLEPLFQLLDQELAEVYGYSFNWNQIIHSSGDTRQNLRQDILTAKEGDGVDGELLWQTLLTEIFPVTRELYLNMRLTERKRFDEYFSTLFFIHAATQPIINAEKLLALMDAGIVSIVKLGPEYRFEQNKITDQFEFIYTGDKGDMRRDTYRYVVNACGQPRSIETDSAMITRNLLRKGYVHTEEKQTIQGVGKFSYATGSIVVDPLTHEILGEGNDDRGQTHPPVFAVGAMTRGQMIDASMAHGLAESTAIVAENVIQRLKRFSKEE